MAPSGSQDSLADAMAALQFDSKGRDAGEVVSPKMVSV
jgi:hypothetical protein